MIVFLQIVLGRILLIFCCNDNPFLKSCKKIFDVLIVSTCLVGIMGLFYTLPTNEAIQDAAIKNFLPKLDGSFLAFISLMSFFGMIRYPLYIAILEFFKNKIFSHKTIGQVIVLIQVYMFFKLFYTLCLLILMLMALDYKII